MPNLGYRSTTTLLDYYRQMRGSNLLYVVNEPTTAKSSMSSIKSATLWAVLSLVTISIKKRNRYVFTVSLCLILPLYL